jgi:hypothetical protein
MLLVVPEVGLPLCRISNSPSFSYFYTIVVILDELGINKDRYKSLADEMDSTFAELAGY